MKFRGKIGYVETVDKGYGVNEYEVTEVVYRGDVLRAMTRWNRGDGLLDNLTVSNQISVIADKYAYEHFQYIKYVIWEGVAWRVDSVDPSKRPRIILTLGGVYNGPQEEPVSDPGSNSD